MSVGLNHYIVLSAILFAIGLYGVLSRRNVVAILMCIELMLNAVNVVMVAFSRYITPQALTGQVFAIFIMTVAAAEVAVGLSIVIAIYRNRETVQVQEIDMLRW